MKIVVSTDSCQALTLLHNVDIHPEKIHSSAVPIHSHPVKLRPRVFAEYIAKQNIDILRDLHRDCTIISFYRIAACGNRVLPYTESEDEARRSLKLISGRRHTVYTSLMLLSPENKLFKRGIKTIVKFKRLHQKEIEEYLTHQEWKNNPGGYSIQGRASGLISWLSGSYHAVAGAPVFEIKQLLQSIKH